MKAFSTLIRLRTVQAVASSLVTRNGKGISYPQMYERRISDPRDRDGEMKSSTEKERGDGEDECETER